MGKKLDRNQAIDTTSKMHGPPNTGTGICMKNSHTKMIITRTSWFDQWMVVIF
jgi:hypothetical protein